MRTNDIPISNGKQAPFLELTYSPPERSFTTAWLESDRGFLRINLTIIGPVSKEPEYYLPLSSWEGNAMLQALSNEIISLEEKLR